MYGDTEVFQNASLRSYAGGSSFRFPRLFAKENTFTQLPRTKMQVRMTLDFRRNHLSVVNPLTARLATVAWADSPGTHRGFPAGVSRTQRGRGPCSQNNRNVQKVIHVCLGISHGNFQVRNGTGEERVVISKAVIGLHLRWTTRRCSRDYHFGHDISTKDDDIARSVRRLPDLSSVAGIASHCVVLCDTKQTHKQSVGDVFSGERWHVGRFLYILAADGDNTLEEATPPAVAIYCTRAE